MDGQTSNEKLETVLKNPLEGKLKEAAISYLDRRSVIRSWYQESTGYMARTMNDRLQNGIPLGKVEADIRTSILEHTQGDFQKVELMALDGLVNGVKQAVKNEMELSEDLTVYAQLSKSQRDLVNMIEKDTQIRFDRRATGDKEAVRETMNQYVAKARANGFVLKGNRSAKSPLVNKRAAEKEGKEHTLSL